MSGMFQPIKRESTREKVCVAIREAIFSGKLKTGQRLTEISLAAEFHVSRPLMREALQQLAHEGLVEQNAYKGTQVVDLTPGQVDEIIGVRLLLEPEAMRLAKLKLSKAHKERIRKMADAVERMRGEPELFPRADFEFHEYLWRLAGNETLYRHLNLLTSRLFSMGSIMRHKRVNGDAAGAPQKGDHRKLAEKICDGAIEDAVEAMRTHIEESRTRTRTTVEKFHEIEKGARKRQRAAAANTK